MKIRRILLPVVLLLASAVVVPAAETRPAFRLLRAPAEARQHAFWELDFQCDGVPKFNPHVRRLDAEVRCPDGTTRTVPAYWTRPHRFLRREAPETLPDGGTRIRVVETPEPLADTPAHWRVRYTPMQPGLHQVRLLLVETPPDAPAVRRTLWQGAVAVAAAEGKGFLRRLPDRRDTLGYADGSGFFAIGFNVCWPPGESGVSGYVHYLDRLHESGCNHTRLWLCTWGFQFETPTPYAYDLGEAAQIDAVFAAARERGITIKLCLDNFHDFLHSPEAGPYFAPNGPCRVRPDFFTDPEAIRIHAAKLRYVVARYGGYPNLFAWELWNEMNYTLEYWWDTEAGAALTDAELAERYYLPWTRQAARRLRALDPYGHPVTTSLGWNEVWDALWRLPELDIVQQHSYIRRLPMWRDPVENDAAALVLHTRARLAGFGRPTLLAEFGYMGTNEDNPFNDADTEGVALHNALWAGAFSRHAGTPMIWWWDYYLERHDLYHHYRALADFLAGVDWARPKQRLVGDNDPDVRVLVLMDDRWAGVWVQNRRATWRERVERGRTPPTLDDVTLQLAGFPP
ncbi:MAG: hypothetical protein ACOCX4_06530, partial [Planctomycetota bacterium]